MHRKVNLHEYDFLVLISHSVLIALQTQHANRITLFANPDIDRQMSSFSVSSEPHFHLKVQQTTRFQLDCLPFYTLLISFSLAVIQMSFSKTSMKLQQLKTFCWFDLCGLGLRTCGNDPNALRQIRLSIEFTISEIPTCDYF